MKARDHALRERLWLRADKRQHKTERDRPKHEGRLTHRAGARDDQCACLNLHRRAGPGEATHVHPRAFDSGLDRHLALTTTVDETNFDN